MDRRLGGCVYFLVPGRGLTVVTDVGLSRHIALPFEPEKGTSVVEAKSGALDCPISGGGNEIVFFLTSSRLPDLITRSKLKARGLRVLSSYFVVPGFSNPRWFLPNSRRLIKSSGNMVKPSRLKARIAWGLAKILSFSGYPELIFPDRIIIATRESTDAASKGILSDFLSVVLNADDLEIMMYTGVHNYYQKFTAQVMGPDGTIMAYAKIGHTEQAHKRMENEARTLDSLQGYGLTRISTPRLICLDRLGKVPNIILVQTPPPTGYSEWEKKFDERHIDALAELYCKTKGVARGDEILSEAIQSLSTLADGRGMFRDPFRAAEDALSLLSPLLRGRDVSVGLSHGDFTPWNLYLRGKNLFMFDWELASLRLPLWDAYNFILHSEVLIHGRDAEEILAMIEPVSGKYSGLLERYESLTDTGASLDRCFLLAWYLLEVLILYMDISWKNHSCKLEGGINGEDVAQTASSMLSFTLQRINNGG